MNEQQALLRESAVKLAREQGGPKRLRELRKDGLEMDSRAWKHFVEAGWLGTAVPEAGGGLGMGLFEVSLAIEEAGKNLLALPITEATAATWALSQGEGTRIPDDVMDGSSLLVPAFAQEGWLDASHAAPKLEGHRLSGTVRFVPYAASAQKFLVLASDNRGPVLALVAKDATRVSVATAANVDGSTSSEVVFKEASAEVVARGDAASRLALQVRELLALGAGIELVGVSSAALDMTLEYIKVRHQFGKPLGSFQALQHRAADCFVDVELNRSLAYRVYSAWDAGHCHPAMVAAVKARSSRGAMDVTRNALQLHGAIGYTDEHDIGLYYKRAIVLAAMYGNEINQTGRFSRLTLAGA